jgi:acyl-CoA thioester hydrolase
MLQSTLEIQVRYSETDAMGVAHHSSYVAWLEMARIALLDELGLPYCDLEAQGTSMPVVRLEINYARPCRFHDRVHITTTVTDPPRARMEVAYALSCEGQPIATASTTLAFVSGAGKPCKPPQALRDLFDRVL